MDANWPNALMDAADLIAERGWSRYFHEDPDTGAINIETALKLGLGFTWTETTDDDGDPTCVLQAPNKAASKLYQQMSKDLLDVLIDRADPGMKVPSVGWWNCSQDGTEPELVISALRTAGVNYEENRARVARYRNRS